MKLIESWRFAVKCIKLSYNLKINLLCEGFMAVLALLQMFTIRNNGAGVLMLMVVAMYPTQMLFSVCGSQLVQSSPYRKPIMTSLTTVITFCCSILLYLTVSVIQGIRVITNPETAGNCVRVILASGMLLMFMEVYITVVYRYFLLSIMVMIGSMLGFSYIAGLFESEVAAFPWFSGISVPVAAVLGLGLTVLGSLLQYGISLLVYKCPIENKALYGMLQKQA